MTLRFSFFQDNLFRNNRMYKSRSSLVLKVGKGLSLHMKRVAPQAGAYLGVRCTKRLGVFLLPH